MFVCVCVCACATCSRLTITAGRGSAAAPRDAELDQWGGRLPVLEELERSDLDRNPELLVHHGRGSLERAARDSGDVSRTLVLLAVVEEAVVVARETLWALPAKECVDNKVEPDVPALLRGIHLVLLQNGKEVIVLERSLQVVPQAPELGAVLLLLWREGDGGLRGGRGGEERESERERE